MSYDNFFAVIMAGGGGTRLWPLSRRERPKQVLRLIADDSLFQVAVRRLEGLFSDARICVVTVKEQAELLRDQCPGLPTDNFILEPMPRGTASVVGLAAIALKHRHPQAVMAILTADHFIADIERFRDLLQAAYEIAQEGHLVTLGITPTYAATGYGYIQHGALLGTYQGTQAFHVERFKEKPDEAQAKTMLESNDHAWNSGMFIWRVDRILAEFARQMPDLYAQLEHIDQAWDTPHRQKVIADIWPTLREETIDYGIMEHALDTVVIPATGLGWSDVGSWDSLFDVLPVDDNGNIVIGGKHFGINTNSSLLYMDHEHRLIVTIGVEDLIVVDTGDVLLVCQKDQAQKVRQVVNHLKQTHQEYL